MDRDHPSESPCPAERRSFYPHLVATLTAQVAVILVAAATGSMATWSWISLLVLAVALAAHAAVVFAPGRPSATGGTAAACREIPENPSHSCDRCQG